MAINKHNTQCRNLVNLKWESQKYNHRYQLNSLTLLMLKLILTQAQGRKCF